MYVVYLCLHSPPEPHQDACSWILSDSNKRSFALISALPSSGIRQIRIHWLLNAVTLYSESVLKPWLLLCVLWICCLWLSVHLYEVVTFTLILVGVQSIVNRVERASLVPWVGGPPDAFVGFYLRGAFQSQTNTEKILYNKSH